MYTRTKIYRSRTDLTTSLPETRTNRIFQQNAFRNNIVFRRVGDGGVVVACSSSVMDVRGDDDARIAAPRCETSIE